MMGMIPGFNADMFGGGQADGNSTMMIKRYITIIESMTEAELDSTNIKLLQEPSRQRRLARGSGGWVREGWVLVCSRGGVGRGVGRAWEVCAG